MTREEAVRLVSRALAVIQFVSAVEEITYLPQRMFSAHHYAGLGAGSYLQAIYSFDVSTLLLRIAGLLVLAWIFWHCGPWVANLLMPATSGSGTKDRSGADEPGSNLLDS